MHTSIAGLGDIPAENWNQSLLWPRLENALNNVLAGPILLIIDALDECQESSASLLLENIGSLLNRKSESQNNCVKVLISSRPTISFKGAIQPFVTTLSVDTEEIFERLQEDVQRLINYEMGRLATVGHWTQEMKTVLGGELRGKAGMLRVLVGAMRPLTTKEFRMALAIISSGNQSLELEGIEKARDRNIKQSIRNVLKSLAYVRGNKVQLYHLSTKEFLLRLSVGKVNNLESFKPYLQSLYGITLHAANLDLARACITFLGLDDFNEDMDKTQDEALSAFAELPAYADDDDQLASASIDVPAMPSPSSSCSEDEKPAKAKMLSVKEKIEKHLFYAYSATYWTSHLRLVGSFTTQELLESSIHISDPNENCLMHWSDLYRSSSQEWVALPKPLDPLIISAFFGVVSLGSEVFKQLPYQEESNKSLALCWACRMGHVDVVGMLLAHKTPLTEQQPDGRWPISWACSNGHLKIVEMLLKEDRESQINLPDSKNRSPLSLAVEFGDLAITKLLIAVEGIDLEMTDNDGCTPIHWSIGSKMGPNDVKQLKYLLTVNEIDISRRDNRGRTVLSWAAEKGALNAINILLKSQRSEIGALLEDTGDISYGRSPLGYAAFYGHAKVVEAFCKTRKADAQLASVDKKGQNAVVLAADRNNWEVIHVLAKYYPEGLDVPDQDGRTPLSAAMWADDNENNAKTIRTLVEIGVDVNKRSINGRTPLSYAASAGRVNMIRILVEEGNANMDIADNEGVLPEDYGVEGYNQKVKDEFRRLRAARPATKA
ncbi:Ankyrin repeat-containing domain protein [Hyaloscypha variabilis]